MDYGPSFMLPNSQKVRINNQLVETSDEEISKLAKNVGMSTTPTNPQSVDALGGTPGQVGQAGSGPQKQGALRRAIEEYSTPKKTLDQATRQTSPSASPQQVLTKEQIAAQQALQGTKGLDQSIQALVNNKLAEQSQVALQVDQTQLDPHAQKAEIEPLLTEYASLLGAQDSTSVSRRNQIQADLYNNYGITDPSVYFDTSTSALQGQINVTGLTGADLAAELDQATQDALTTLIPNWQELDIDSFQQRLTSVQQEHLNKVNSIRARLAATPPGSAQAELLLAELRSLGETGMTGTEAAARSLVEQMQKADTVSVGGREFQVADLLKSEEISRLVADYLNPEIPDEFKKSLRSEQPGLVSWIETNQSELAKLSTTLQAETTAFNQRQEEARELASSSGFNTEALDVLFGWDSSDAVADVPDFSSNPIWQASQDEDVGTYLLDTFLNVKPEAAREALAGMSAEEIVDAAKVSRDYETSETVKFWMGSKGPRPGEFITDPAQREQVKYFQTVFDAALDGSLSSAVMATDDFRDLVQSGELTPEIAIELTDAEFGEFVENKKLIDDLTTADTLEELLDAIGLVADTGTLNEWYQNAQIAADFDDNPDFAARLEKLKELDTNNNNQIDPGDFAGLKQKLTERTPESNISVFAAGQKFEPPVTDQDLGNLSDLATSIKGYLADGQITADEVRDMGPDLATRLGDDPRYADQVNRARDQILTEDVYQTASMSPTYFTELKKSTNGWRSIGLDGLTALENSILRLKEQLPALSGPMLDRAKEVLADMEGVYGNARWRTANADAQVVVQDIFKQPWQTFVDAVTNHTKDGTMLSAANINNARNAAKSLRAAADGLPEIHRVVFLDAARKIEEAVNANIHPYIQKTTQPVRDMGQDTINTARDKAAPDSGDVLNQIVSAANPTVADPVIGAVDRATGGKVSKNLNRWGIGKKK